MTADASQEKVGVIGAGRMGRSIAAACALAGYDFYLIDLRQRDDAAFATLQQDIVTELQGIFLSLQKMDMLKDKHIDTLIQKIHVTGSGQASLVLPQMTILLEAVPETIEAKQQALAIVSTYATSTTIVASTSSTMLVSQLADLISHPERFMNAHWLNPAYLVPLVEIASHPGTATVLQARLMRWLESIGKVAVLCQGQPGYIVPRLQVLLMNEAARMIEQGAATAEEIDKAIRYGFGPRYASMGVVEFIDFGGVDILYHASRYLEESLQDARYRCPDIVNRKMQNGNLGIKSGEGFYHWTSERATRFQRQSMERFAHILQEKDMPDGD